MKKLFFLFLLYPMIGISQSTPQIQYVFNNIPVCEKDIRYLDTVQAADLKREDIYGSVKKWIALNYRSANDVIQLDNKEGGEVLVKGIMDPGFSMLGSPFRCFHTLLIAFKDGKYRTDLTIYEITTTSTYVDRQPPFYYYNKLSKRNAERLFTAIDTRAHELLGSLKKSMSSSKDDKW